MDSPPPDDYQEDDLAALPDLPFPVGSEEEQQQEEEGGDFLPVERDFSLPSIQFSRENTETPQSLGRDFSIGSDFPTSPLHRGPTFPPLPTPPKENVKKVKTRRYEEEEEERTPTPPLPTVYEEEEEQQVFDIHPNTWVKDICKNTKMSKYKATSQQVVGMIAQLKHRQHSNFAVQPILMICFDFDKHNIYVKYPEKTKEMKTERVMDELSSPKNHDVLVNLLKAITKHETAIHRNLAKPTDCYYSNSNGELRITGYENAFYVAPYRCEPLVEELSGKKRLHKNKTRLNTTLLNEQRIKPFNDQRLRRFVFYGKNLDIMSLLSQVKTKASFEDLKKMYVELVGNNTEEEEEKSELGPEERIKIQLDTRRSFILGEEKVVFELHPQMVLKTKVQGEYLLNEIRMLTKLATLESSERDRFVKWAGVLYDSDIPLAICYTFYVPFKVEDHQGQFRYLRQLSEAVKILSRDLKNKQGELDIYGKNENDDIGVGSKRGFIHSNIVPGSIYFNTSTNQLCLGGFDFAHYYDDAFTNSNNDYTFIYRRELFTPFPKRTRGEDSVYYPPELYAPKKEYYEQKDEPNQYETGLNTDSWSIGCFAIDLFTGTTNTSKTFVRNRKPASFTPDALIRDLSDIREEKHSESLSSDIIEKLLVHTFVYSERDRMSPNDVFGVIQSGEVPSF